MPPTTSRATRIAAKTAGALALVAVGVGLGQFLSTSSRRSGWVAVDRVGGNPAPAALPVAKVANTTAPTFPNGPAAAAAPVAGGTTITRGDGADATPASSAKSATRTPPRRLAARPTLAVQALATPEAAAAAGVQTLPPGTPGPEVISNPGEITAVVPVAGSTAGAVKYALTQPRGIAIDLPQAQSTLAVGRHPVFNDGFRFVSIRPRVGGGIRVAFTYAYYTPRLLDVTVDDAAIRVRVAPPRPAAP